MGRSWHRSGCCRKTGSKLTDNLGRGLRAGSIQKNPRSEQRNDVYRGKQSVLTLRVPARDLGQLGKLLVIVWRRRGRMEEGSTEPRKEQQGPRPAHCLL